MSIDAPAMTPNQELAGGIAENLGLSDKKRQWIWDYLKHYNKAADEAPDQPVELGCIPAFEAWAKSVGIRGYDLTPAMDNDGDHHYRHHRTWDAWEGWRAAWQSRPKREIGDETTMGLLLRILSDAGVEAKGLLTWEEGMRAIRRRCHIFNKKPNEIEDGDSR